MASTLNFGAFIFVGTADSMNKTQIGKNLPSYIKKPSCSKFVSMRADGSGLH